MLKIAEKNILVQAPGPTAWEAIYNVDCWKSWNPTIGRVELLETPKLGAIGRIHNAKANSFQFRITRLILGSYFEWERSFEAGTILKQSYSITKNAEGSIFTTELFCEGNFEKIVVGITRSRFVRDLEKQLLGFQGFCESQWNEEQKFAANNRPRVESA